MDLQDELVSIIATQEKKYCAIATVSLDRKPECAIVGYSILDRLTLLFNTESTSRKWKNLKQNPSVALSIGWDASKPFLQYEGVATLVDASDPAYQAHNTLFFGDHPHSLAYKDLPTSVFFVVRPTWIRLVDVTRQPVRQEEVHL